MVFGKYCFGGCMACRCLMEPIGVGGDEILNRRARNINTLCARVNEPGKHYGFFSTMEKAHMIQKKGAWPAVEYWVCDDAVNEDLAVNIDKWASGRASWKSPAPLCFEKFNEWIKKTHMNGDLCENDFAKFLTINDTYVCCRECNLLMDVEGHMWHLLWSTVLGHWGINPNDTETTRLIPTQGITITSPQGVKSRIPSQAAQSGAIRQTHYSAVLAYFIHRCVKSYKFPVGIQRRTGYRVTCRRLSALMGVYALKLLALRSEFMQRWSPVVDLGERRSPHNYSGVIHLYISFVMYMLYKCDGRNLSKPYFEVFHLFFMSEMVQAPKWDRSEYKDLWQFVLRQSDLADATASTTVLLQRVVDRLIELYQERVCKLLAVLHPIPSVFSTRLNLRDNTFVKTIYRHFFVSAAEINQLMLLHDAVTTKELPSQFSHYVMQFGIGPIAWGIRRMFAIDGAPVTGYIDAWRQQCTKDEWARMKEHNRISLPAAAALYHLCYVAAEDLAGMDLLRAGEDRVTLVQTQGDVATCRQALTQGQLCSVWKAALLLRRYGNCLVEPSQPVIQLPQVDKEVVWMNVLNSRWTEGPVTAHWVWGGVVSMRTGLPVALPTGCENGVDGGIPILSSVSRGANELSARISGGCVYRAP